MTGYRMLPLIAIFIIAACISLSTGFGRKLNARTTRATAFFVALISLLMTIHDFILE